MRCALLAGVLSVVLALCVAGCGHDGSRLERPAGSDRPAAAGQIAFESIAGGNLDIFVVNFDGSGLTRLTKNTNILDAHPSWSADGSRIAFASARSGTRS